MSLVLSRDVVRALGHPLRLRVLDAIIVDGETSPVQLSRRLGNPLPTISRHVRLLRDLGFIELTRSEPRRGAVEHFYRARRRALIGEEEWAELPVALRRGLVGQTFANVFHEASVAGGAGGFDAPQAHLDRVSLDLDEEGRQELSRLLTGVLDEAERIRARSDTRRRDSDEAAVASTMVLLHFTRGED
jgi:DNA-binding transcriptional ArsR family regulator